MTQVFISYSRKDVAFVKRLHEALNERQYDTWVDWEGIPPSDKWMASVHAAIDATEAFVFIISPDSTTSQVCSQELAYAIQQHKRLLPVLHRESGAEVPPSLAEINYIFARESDPFEAAVDTLIQAINTDLDWVRSHTRLLIRAVEWDSSKRESSLTLRGRELSDFEEWAVKAADKDPKPTVLQSEYLLASRRTVARRQRITGFSVAAGMCIAIGLGTVAWFQNQQSRHQRQVVEARQLLSKAEVLRDTAASDSTTDIGHAASLRAATRALAAFDRLGEPTLDADLALRKSYALMAKWTDLDTGHLSHDVSAFDYSGRFVGLVLGGREISVWDSQAQQGYARCNIELTASQSGTALSLSADGHRIAAYLYTADKKATSSPVIVWSLPACELLSSISVAHSPQSGTDGLRDMALSPDGAMLAILTDKGLDLWDLARQTHHRVFSDAQIRMIAVAPDSSRIATYEYRKADRDKAVERARLVRIRSLPLGEILHTLEIPHYPDKNFTWAGSTLLVGKQKISVDQGLPTLVDGPDIKGNRQAFSHDGQRVATWVKGKSIEIRNAETNALIASTTRSANMSAFAFAPNDNLVTVDASKHQISVWHYQTPLSYARLKTSGAIRRIGFSNKQEQLIATGLKIQLHWRLPDPGGDTAVISTEHTTISPPPPVPQKDFSAFAEAYSTAGHRARIIEGSPTRGGPNRSLQIWQDGSQIAQASLPPVLDNRMGRYLQFAGDGHFVITGSREGLMIFRTNSLTRVATLFHRDVVLAEISPGGQHAVTMARDHSVRIWDLATGLQTTRLSISDAARALALSNDGRWLAALHSEDGTLDSEISLWALKPADLIAQSCRWLEAPCP